MTHAIATAASATTSTAAAAAAAAVHVQQCTSMQQVRCAIDALDDILVPLLVTRSHYMTQAARIKQDPSHVRDEARIEAIVQRVRACASAQGGAPDVIEAIYRSMMEAYIAFEHREFARLRSSSSHAQEGTL